MEELKYKVGDEVLIKGKVVDTGEPYNTNYPYEIVFDDDDMVVSWSEWFSITSVVGMASDLVKSEDQKTYEQGLNDAWEMAKLISSMPLSKVMEIFNGSSMGYITNQYSAQEAINKYNEWKESNDFKMGDIVEYDIGAGLDDKYEEIHRAIFYSETEDAYWVLRDQCLAPQSISKKDFKLRKVGESGLDIAGALAKIRDEED